MNFKQIVIDKLDETMGAGNYRLICVARTGSHAYGIEMPDSDSDLVALFLPTSPHYFFGMKKIEHVDLNKTAETEGTCYDFRFWYGLMVKQNPNVLELLWHAEQSYQYRDTVIWPMIYAAREQLLSKKLKHSFTGYSYDQLMRIEKLNIKANQNAKRRASIEKYGYDVKAASTALRLLNTALEALVEGHITVLRPDRTQLIAIREGRYTYAQLQELAVAKQQLIEEAYVRSDLRNRIDYEFANDLLVNILKTHLQYKVS